jgi:hypothetical protein
MVAARPLQPKAFFGELNVGELVGELVFGELVDGELIAPKPPP